MDQLHQKLYHVGLLVYFLHLVWIQQFLNLTLQDQLVLLLCRELYQIMKYAKWLIGLQLVEFMSDSTKDTFSAVTSFYLGVHFAVN